MMYSLQWILIFIIFCHLGPKLRFLRNIKKILYKQLFSVTFKFLNANTDVSLFQHLT